MEKQIEMAETVVSTHSRPKAAGTANTGSINPPMFQHTAARRRLVGYSVIGRVFVKVSTHSRPKAAGLGKSKLLELLVVSTHSRPKAAGSKSIRRMDVLPFQHTAARRRLGLPIGKHLLCRRFNTQPPEGGWGTPMQRVASSIVSTHSRPKAAGALRCSASRHPSFQHTAARRRLGLRSASTVPVTIVSTHSRLKAAGPT